MTDLNHAVGQASSLSVTSKHNRLNGIERDQRIAPLDDRIFKRWRQARRLPYVALPASHINSTAWLKACSPKTKTPPTLGGVLFESAN
jgi:hypothetical protein